MIILSTEIKSFISPVCVKYIGQVLTLRTEDGWGWQEHHLGEWKSINQNEIINAYFGLLVKEFWKNAGCVIGLIGFIEGKDTHLNGVSVMAIPMTWGENFDFESNICHIWRLVLGNGIQLSEDGMSIESKEESFICGYGTIARSSEVIRDRVPGIAELDEKIPANNWM